MPRRAAPLLMRAKSNIGPDDGGFAYELERVEVAPEVEGQRVVVRALQGSARELLAEAEADPSDDGATVSASSDAAEFLHDMLQGAHPVSSRDVGRRMKAEGFTDKVIRTAREKLGVIVERTGFGKDMQSLWSLPVVPSDSHSCPVAPTKKCGQEWAGLASVGTNDGPAIDAERI